MAILLVKTKEYLNKAYPFYYGSWDSLLAILTTVSLLSFSFSYFFEPFEVNQSEHKLDYFWICLIHALLPIIIAFLYLSALNKITTNDRGWTVGKEALHLSILLVLIGIGSFLVRDVIYDNPNNWSTRYFWEEIRNTFLVGFLLLVILLPLNLERLLKKYKDAAGRLRMNNTQQLPESRNLAIETPIASESFELDASCFLFAKVDGNYLEVYLRKKEESIPQKTGISRNTSASVEKEDDIVKKLVRLSLKELQEQLSAFSFIFQTHRSYLVNIHHVKSVSGNAQGYLLSLSGCNIEVPVSRSKISEFNALFPQNN